MADAWKSEFGSAAPQTVGALINEVVDGQMTRSMSANQRAARAWARANGDRERTHTTGVFLKRPRVAGADPILGVYVDSHAMATDFGVNKDIYLARLANVGFAVSGIEFLPSRTGRRGASVRSDKVPTPAPEALPELSPHERVEVEQLVDGLPEQLRGPASRAVSLAKQRKKLETSKQEQHG